VGTKGTGGPGTNQYARREPSCPVPAGSGGRLLVQTAQIAPAKFGLADGLSLGADSSTHPMVLDWLGGSQHREVRYAVAGNSSSWPATLVRLASDPDRAVRQQAAANPACPPEQLRELAQDPDTLLAVAANPACPPAILAQIWETGTELIAQHIAGRMSSQPELKTDLEELRPRAKRLTVMVAANPACPSATLVQILQDGDIWQHNMASTLRTVGISIWPGLRARRGDFTVGQTVAAHPRCPPDVLAGLLASEDRQVQREAAANPRCPRAALAMWQLARGADR